jgi:hypothetical protein
MFILLGITVAALVLYFAWSPPSRRTEDIVPLPAQGTTSATTQGGMPAK